MSQIYDQQYLILNICQTMQKKQNLKKIKKCQQVKGCLICKIIRIPSIGTIASVVLLQKYYRPTQKSNYAYLIHALTRPLSYNIRANYREVRFIANRDQTLLKYNNFTSIISKIKPVVHDCAKRDKLIPMHYHEKSYSTMLIHSLAKRKIKSVRLPPRKNQKTESTDEDQIQSYKQIPNQNKRINIQANQTASIRRLTRNLSSMVQKFQDQCDFHSSFILDLMNLASRHAIDCTNQEQDIFKKYLQSNNISEIRVKTEFDTLTTEAQRASRKFQQNYGLQSRKKNANQQYKVFIKDRKKMVSPNMGKPLKQNIPQRIQTDYDCETIKKAKKKSSNSTSKRENDKTGKKFLGSLSKKKDSKICSAAKSRVK